MIWRDVLSWEGVSDDFIEEGQGFFTEEKDQFGNIYRYNRKGQLHNTRGPAIIFADGTEWYYQNGKYHRTDGPAIIYTDGTVWYYVNDKELTEEEFNQKYGQNRQASLKFAWEDDPTFELGDRVRIGIGRTEVVYRIFPDLLLESGAKRDSAIASRNAFYDKLENAVGTITYVFDSDINELPQYRVQLDDHDLHQTMRRMIGSLFYGHQLDKV